MSINVAIPDGKWSFGYGLHTTSTKKRSELTRYNSIEIDKALYKYGRFSLSRLRLSGITAYIEEKIWSFF